MPDFSLPTELLSRVAHLPVDVDRPGTVDVVNPATEKTLTTMTVAGPDTVDAAVTSARQASAGWAGTGPAGRRVALRTLAARLRDHAEELATTITLEHGRPFTDARAEAHGAADLVETYAELAVAHRTGVQGSASGELVFHRSEPWGVVACVTPWNYPLMAVLNLVAPALAAGNTVVLKPSEKTPASAALLVEWCTDHLPPGVLNLVLGTGETTGSALVRHPDIDLVALTGGVATGRRVSELAGERLRKTILELGGKDAMVVDDTVDVRVAARMAAQAAFDNSGQICTSIERIYVHEAIKDDFVAQLAEEAAAWRVGDGFEAGVRMGPVVDQAQLDTIVDHVDSAVAQGAVVVCGGRRLNRTGYFFPPTVLSDVPPSVPVLTEETFGPVAPVVCVRNFEDAITRANESEYGLGAMVLTKDPEHAMLAVERLRVGSVKINAMRGRVPGTSAEPAGVSGIGAGYGPDALQEFARQKSVQWRAVPQ
jgi:acyl-CoA reductase-like NAD-dependent aldehyde dehydrogenase